MTSVCLLPVAPSKCWSAADRKVLRGITLAGQKIPVKITGCCLGADIPTKLLQLTIGSPVDTRDCFVCVGFLRPGFANVASSLVGSIRMLCMLVRLPGFRTPPFLPDCDRRLSSLSSLTGLVLIPFWCVQLRHPRSLTLNSWPCSVGSGYFGNFGVTFPTIGRYCWQGCLLPLLSSKPLPITWCVPLRPSAGLCRMMLGLSIPMGGGLPLCWLPFPMFVPSCCGIGVSMLGVQFLTGKGWHRLKLLTLTLAGPPSPFCLANVDCSASWSVGGILLWTQDP